MNPSSSRLRPVTDVSPADWVVAGVGPFGGGVGALVPHGFESYARILHPAESAEGRPVTWAAVGKWSGGTVHATAQFASLSHPQPGFPPTGSAPWEEEPRAGELPPAILSALCEVLAAHTSTAQRCWFCLWDGYGWITGSPAVSVVTSSTSGPGGSESVLPAFSPEILNGPRVDLPGRAHLLLEGPLDAALGLGHSIGNDVADPQTPNLFWPDDHAWCCATDVDLDSTYVGGSAALVRDLLADHRLEVWAVDIDDPVTADRDKVNHPGSS